MKEKLTKKLIDQIQPTDKRLFIWDTEVTGFGLQVTTRGTKSYVFQYRRPGHGRRSAAKRISLGQHGDLTLAQAQKIAANHLLAVKAGKDPAVDRAAPDTNTVRELSKRFLKKYLPAKKKPPRQSTIDFYEIIFEKHINPRLGSRRVAEVTGTDLDKLHTTMRDTPYMANRTLSVIQQAFDQAERWGLRPKHTNPALHIDKYPEKRRGARKAVMLTAKQMARLLEAIDIEEGKKNGVSPISCNAIRVTFWTGWRIGEVLSLAWANLDLESGVARLVKTKASAEEYRHVPQEALEILRRMPKVAGCRFVFPGRGAAHLTTVKRPWRKIRKRAKLDTLDGLGPLRLHDLRHNVVSWDVSRGVPLEIAGKNVGHRSRRSTEVYAHFAPESLKRAADERASAMRKAVDAEQEDTPGDTSAD